MTQEQAIMTLDEVIPTPQNPMVDLSHLHIAQAWEVIKTSLYPPLAKWTAKEKSSQPLYFGTCSNCGNYGEVARFCCWCGRPMEGAWNQ